VKVPADRIKHMADKNLLGIAGALSFASCPRCNSMHLNTIMRCPSCLRQSLSKIELVVHYECSHVAPLQEVTVPGSGEYVCPKCGKKMKRVGIDYGRPGLGFKCLSCGEVSQYPSLMLLCEEGHDFKIDRQELRIFPIYRLGEALRTMPRMMTHLTETKMLLSEHQTESVLLAQVKGMSGSTYIAPLLVPGIPPLIADFMLDEEGWEFQVLQTIKKSVDLNSRILLVVKDRLLEFVRDMVNPERITVIMFDDESTIPKLATEAILQMQSNPNPLPRQKFEAHQQTGPEGY